MCHASPTAGHPGRWRRQRSCESARVLHSAEPIGKMPAGPCACPAGLLERSTSIGWVPSVSQISKAVFPCPPLLAILQVAGVGGVAGDDSKVTVGLRPAGRFCTLVPSPALLQAVCGNAYAYICNSSSCSTQAATSPTRCNPRSWTKLVVQATIL